MVRSNSRFSFIFFVFQIIFFSSILSHKLHAQNFSRKVGSKEFEIKNHLGDVSVVLIDEKFPIDKNNLSLGFNSSIESYYNYFSFGMQQPGRNFSSFPFRFGINGKERDDEIKGFGNSYDYAARIFDPRNCKWLSIDPKAINFPEQSPYNFSLNNPVFYVDGNGKEPASAELLRVNTHGTFLDPRLTLVHKGLLVGSVATAFGIIIIITGGTAAGPGAVATTGGTAAAGTTGAAVGTAGAAGAIFARAGAFFQPLILWAYANPDKVNMVGNFLYGAICPECPDNPSIPMDDAGRATSRAVANAAPEVKAAFSVITQAVKKSCFVGGTTVWEKKGLIPIEQIVDGDSVWSFNELKGKNELNKVTKVFVNKTDKLINLYAGNEQILTTPEHPFYSFQLGQMATRKKQAFIEGTWIPAKNLQKGKPIFLITGKSENIRSFSLVDTTLISVYNFEVEMNHNYYVSSKGILVHNDCQLVNKLWEMRTWIRTQNSYIIHIEAAQIQLQRIPGMLKRLGDLELKLTQNPHNRVALTKEINQLKSLIDLAKKDVEEWRPYFSIKKQLSDLYEFNKQLYEYSLKVSQEALEKLESSKATELLREAESINH